MSIVIENLNFTYSEKSPFAKKALDNVSLTIHDGDFLGIIGHTGSGKSTLIQHINGLIKLKSGKIQVFDIDLQARKPDLKRLRSEVGMVFQYPEYQLFDETVAKDVAFGPKNLGLSKEEIEERVRWAMEMTGLNYLEFASRSPFELSGGQKRRAAIAGVIAMRPKVLILDEPTAGLDPQSKDDILSLVMRLKENSSPTVIMIGHDIDELSRYCSRMAVLEQGKLVYDLPTTELFSHVDALLEMGLDLPQPVAIASRLKKKGIDLGGGIVTPQELVEAIERYRKEKGGRNA